MNIHRKTPLPKFLSNKAAYFISDSVTLGRHLQADSKIQNNTEGMSIHFLIKSFLKIIVISTLNFEVTVFDITVFNIGKMTLFRRLNTVISSTLIQRQQFLKHYNMRTKMFLWSTQNEGYFNIKFRR